MSAIPAPGAIAPIMPSGRLVLKYLFGAHFQNGEEYFQTPEDESPFTPGRNAYYELLKTENGEPVSHPDTGRLLVRDDVELFQLEGEGCRYLVDLRDGHFEIGGAPFFVAIPPSGQKLYLLYFRRRRHHTNVTVTVNSDLQPEVMHASEGGQECEYHFGWITADGKHSATLVLV